MTGKPEIIARRADLRHSSWDAKPKTLPPELGARTALAASSPPRPLVFFSFSSLTVLIYHRASLQAAERRGRDAAFPSQADALLTIHFFRKEDIRKCSRSRIAAGL
jgi:hypothetical protein